MLSITFFNDIEGIDLGQKFLQVFAGSFETKNRKRGQGKAETEVGFPSRDMIEGIQIQVQEWPLPQVKSTRSGEYYKGEGRRGEWQTKVVSVFPEMGSKSSRGIADVAQIHARMSREKSAPMMSHYALCIMSQVQSSELREWHLHCCPKVFNLPSCIPIDEDFDFTYAIAVLEPSNHIIHGATGLNEER